MAGNDNYVKLLLHCNGTDGSATITDSSPTRKSVNAIGNAQIDTAQSKFGGASLLLDGTGDYATIADSTDWTFGTGDFTIDTWIRFNDVPGALNIIAMQILDTTYSYYNYFAIKRVTGTDKLVFRLYTSGVDQTIEVSLAENVSTGVWYHLAVCRNGNSWYFFKDGVQQGTTQTNSASVADITGIFSIGGSGATGWTTYTINGWIDEFRVSKGIARWTAGFTVPSAAYSGVVPDSYTKLLLHCEGPDVPVVFDECENAVTCNGAAQTDTAQYKFGSASLLLDGSGDYLTVADSDDWYYGTGDFTIDFWVRFNSLGADIQGFIGQYVDADNRWGFYHNKTTNKLWMYGKSGGTEFVSFNDSWTPTTNTWYHIALVRNGTTFTAYVDGASIFSGTDSDAIPNLSASVQIGRYQYGSGLYYDLNGWMDEIRISKGIARWTSAFTPPSAAYGSSTEYEVTISDGLTIDDSLAVQYNPYAVIADSLTIDEAFVAPEFLFATISSSLEISDVSDVSDEGVITDDFSVNDSITVVRDPREITLEEELTFSDVLEVVREHEREAGPESVQVSASFEAAFAGHEYQVTINESLTVADDITVFTNISGYTEDDEAFPGFPKFTLVAYGGGTLDQEMSKFDVSASGKTGLVGTFSGVVKFRLAATGKVGGVGDLSVTYTYRIAAEGILVPIGTLDEIIPVPTLYASGTVRTSAIPSIDQVTDDSVSDYGLLKYERGY